LDITDLADFFNGLEKRIGRQPLKIAAEIIKEIKTGSNFFIGCKV